MEGQLEKCFSRNIGEKAYRNIELFLKELEKRSSQEIEDPHSEEYARKTIEDGVMRILDEYEKRREEVQKKLDNLIETAKIEARNGYSRLSKRQKYKVISKRRHEAEKIVREANLGPRDAKNARILLVENLMQMYEIYGLCKLDKKAL